MLFQEVFYYAVEVRWLLVNLWLRGNVSNEKKVLELDVLRDIWALAMLTQLY